MNHGVFFYIGLFTAPTASGEIIMIKTAIVVGVLWGVFTGVSGVNDLKTGMKHIQDSRQAAIEQATNY